MDNGFKYLEAKGDAAESTYSYTGKTGTCSSSKSASPTLKVGSVTSFNDVTSDSETQMLAAVSKGPVSVAIEADQSGFQFYKTGVFSGTCGANLDHGVLVVGYGTDSGKDYWKVKNSWGTTWGDAGYIRLTRSSTGEKGRKLLGGGGGGGGGTSGECGLLKQPSYPVVSKTEQAAPAPPKPHPVPHEHFCYFTADAKDHKCYDACAKKDFANKGFTTKGVCDPATYTVIENTESLKVCSDGVTNLKYCTTPHYPLILNIKTKGEGKDVEGEVEELTKEAEAAGCKSDTDCHSGGDMGGYCKANSDCHCTMPFFGSNGHTCALTCTPTSKTPCCRSDTDCQKDGDKGAYCKSPKSNLHTTPGNGQCRCGAGFAGTTSCNKA